MRKPKFWQSAYPGSMFEKEDGNYVDRDDNESLARTLVGNVAQLERELESWQDSDIRLRAERDKLKMLNKDLWAVIIRVANLNPGAGEIGEGMLAQLIDAAKQIMHSEARP